VRPAINVGISVSRVGSAAQIKAIKQVAGKVKLELAQYRELAAFSQFASDLDAATKAKLDRGARIVEVFKQAQYQPVSVEQQVIIMWATQNGYFDDVPVDNILATKAKLLDYLGTREEALLRDIGEKKSLDEALTVRIKQAVESFKQSLGG
jgi:F-type H+-transporting ATPase subunit alpha